MKKFVKISLLSLFVASILCSCKKDKTGSPVITQAKCIIQSETYGLASNEKSFTYEYDSDGNLIKVNVLRPNGSPSASYAINGGKIEFDYTFGNKLAAEILHYNTSLYELPSQAFTTLVNEFDGTAFVNYDVYYFYYDIKNQLTEVKTRRGIRTGGFEYDISFNYNDQGNVKSIQYVYWTGPNMAIPLIRVTGYDDKPNPHAGIKGWRFFLINTHWENVDPGAIIAALSQNNPLGFSTGAGSSLFERKIEYEYNSDGFPTLQKNTNTNASGNEYTYYQTFTYVCK